jgi:hypothetical protein
MSGRLTGIWLCLVMTLLFLALGSLSRVDGIKHDCIPPLPGNGENNLASVISRGNNTLSQLNEINDRIISLAAGSNLTLNTTNATGNGNQIISGNPEEIKSEIERLISKESKLNEVQINALNKMVDNAIILEEAQIDPLAPKPNITFKISSSNQTFRITC